MYLPWWPKFGDEENPQEAQQGSNVTVVSFIHWFVLSFYKTTHLYVLSMLNKHFRDYWTGKSTDYCSPKSHSSDPEFALCTRNS